MVMPPKFKPPTNSQPGSNRQPKLPTAAALRAGLAQEQVRDVVGHLLYFSLLLLMSLATIIICVTKTLQGGKLHSRFLLPAAWAIYNAVGPVLFFCAATLKKTKSLELAMYLLSMVRPACLRLCNFRFSCCDCCSSPVLFAGQQVPAEHWAACLLARCDDCTIPASFPCILLLLAQPTSTGV
jgi:hypothetical protein